MLAFRPAAQDTNNSKSSTYTTRAAEIITGGLQRSLSASRLQTQNAKPQKQHQQKLKRNSTLTVPASCDFSELSLGPPSAFIKPIKSPEIEEAEEKDKEERKKQPEKVQEKQLQRKRRQQKQQQKQQHSANHHFNYHNHYQKQQQHTYGGFHNGRVSPLNENQIDRLLKQGYTRGLANSLNATKKAFAKRIWIIDNSGSMQTQDGHRIVIDSQNEQQSHVKMEDCTRWEEIQECVQYHVKLARSIESPTNFRFLNYPGPNIKAEFSVCENIDSGPYDEKNALEILRNVRPSGCTPLTGHILDIYHELTRLMKSSPTSKKLRKKNNAKTISNDDDNKRVLIVIATDGLPTDEDGYSSVEFQNEFVDSIRLLEKINGISLVIRLCTDEEHVVDFYNNLDSKVDIPIEVLDDFVCEGMEVHQYNPWLNYGLPLHRMREMGYHDPVFDLLDERPLTLFEIQDFCVLLFGQEEGVDIHGMDSYLDVSHTNMSVTTTSTQICGSHHEVVPTTTSTSGTKTKNKMVSSRATNIAEIDPFLNLNEFLSRIEELLQTEEQQWNPITKKLEPWINIKELQRIHGGPTSACCIIS